MGGEDRGNAATVGVSWRRHGRREPYTVAGVRRLPCFRCGQPSLHQWSACSDGNLWRPLCLACDIALNRLVLEWMGFDQAEVDAKIATYVDKAERR